jgi:hypothetical protein
VKELKDVTVATFGAYPAASVELRTRNNDGAEERQEDKMEDTAGETTEEREEERPAAGSLRVEDRTAPGDVHFVSLAEMYAAASFFENRVASIGWTEYRSFTWSGGTVSDINPLRREGVALGYDQRWLFPVVPTTAVSDATTSVQYLRQSARTLAGTAVIRAIDAVTTKPETSTTAELQTLTLSQVATVQTGVPRIMGAQPAF